MDEALALYNDLQRFLRVSARITPKKGGLVHVGEKFTVKVTVSNQAYEPSESNPKIVFLDATIIVGWTEYAEIVKKPLQLPIYKFPDDRLSPGDSSSVDLTFKALKAIELYEEEHITEQIAKIMVHARLDYNSFFGIKNYSTIYHDIRPG